MSLYSAAEIIASGRAVALRGRDGRRVRFHAVWLRDNALDAGTRSPGNGQRLVTIGDLPADPNVSSVALRETGFVDFELTPGSIRVRFPADWLADHAYDRDHERAAGWLDPAIETWDAAFAESLPSVDYAAARDERSALAAWLAAVRRYGVARMTGGPVESGR